MDIHPDGGLEMVVGDPVRVRQVLLRPLLLFSLVASPPPCLNRKQYSSLSSSHFEAL